MKQWRRLAASVTAGTGAANDRAGQWWFNREMRALRTRNKCSGRPPEAANDRLRAVTGADPLTPKQEVAEELPLTILRSFGT